MVNGSYPMANTPKIMKLKKQKCLKIWAIWGIFSAICTVLFLFSIWTDYIDSFLFSICCISMPFVSFFAAMFWYLHVKLFPEFDYGPLSSEEIARLPIRADYDRQCRKLRKSKRLKGLILIFIVFFVLFLQCYFRDLTKESQIWENILWVAELLLTCGMVVMIRLLQWDVRERRELEKRKYDRT